LKTNLNNNNNNTDIIHDILKNTWNNNYNIDELVAEYNKINICHL
jgi:hypothetical protein